MADWFKFCGTSCKEYGITVLEFPPIVTPEERTTTHSVPGRSGDLEMREEAYAPIDLPLICYIANWSVSTMAIRTWLSGRGKLIMGNMPDRYYYARMTDAVEFEQIMRGHKQRRFEIPFHCQPFRYHVEAEDGDNAEITASPHTLTNPGTYKSAPRIKVEGTGDVVLTIGTQIVEIEGLEDGIIVDSELGDCFNLTESALLNSKVTLMDDDFPTLAPGENIISWTGNVTKITITPRWRDL